MKAMIFAAGVGSRLGELTRDTPKCLMVANGKTLLFHVLSRLKESGVTDVMINIHHYPDKIREHLRTLSDLDLHVSVSHEPTLLDTGGGLKKVHSFFENEKSFILHNADIYSTIDLAGLVATHLRSNAIGTLAVMQRASKRGLYFDRSARLTAWTGEIPSPSPPKEDALLAFSGVSVASSELFDYMGSEDTFSILQPFLRAARSTHRVFGVRVDSSYWTDIGTPESLTALRERLAGSE